MKSGTSITSGEYAEFDTRIEIEVLAEILEKNTETRPSIIKLFKNVDWRTLKRLEQYVCFFSILILDFDNINKIF